MKRVVILLFVTLYSLVHASYCPSTYKCKRVPGKESPELTNLTCTLPAMPTFTITTPDVLDGSGKLKRYWNEGKTVCDVLGWMNEAVPYLTAHYSNINTSVTTPMTLRLSHLEGATKGGVTGTREIHLDTDAFDAGTDSFDDDQDPDENIHKHRMKYITVHEFWHFIALNTSSVRREHWLHEGEARSFEDIVYDSENPYTDSLFVDHLYSKYEIAFILGNKALSGTSYNGFMFHKLIDNRCPKPDIKNAIASSSLKGRIDAYVQGCGNVPDIDGDKLAGAFVLYNWAMQYEKDIRKFDSVSEPSSVPSEMFRGKYPKVNKPNFTGTLDLKSYVGGSLPPFSAKSFLITHETIAYGCDDINITFDAPGLKLAAVRVKRDGTSDISDNFTMDGNDKTPHKLEETDRKGALFVTVTNTTGKPLPVKEMALVKSKKYVPTPKPGVVEVTLAWDKPELDGGLA